MLSKLKSSLFIVFFALFTQSFFVPTNIAESKVEVNTPINTSKHSEMTSSYKVNPRLFKRIASKIKKSKFNQKKGGYRKKKLPLLIKLGLIFVGVGLVFLLVCFWGWYFAAIGGADTAASWITLLLEGGLGAVGAGLVCLIVGWLAN